jgi:diaminohydroxyphosphoribosylaminopyrimidine deaminase/5-amino-6-(5-phosphoribosylamino)uracil reductase
VFFAYPGSSFFEPGYYRIGGKMNSIEVMTLANQLALQGLGATWPNPIVGAVLLSQSGSFISSGFHNRMNSPEHAEIVARNSAANQSHGAHLFVSLEPCNRHGQTPPCVDSIIGAGITEVNFATADPNPQAVGGAQRLSN